jgi:hypothetical protein
MADERRGPEPMNGSRLDTVADRLTDRVIERRAPLLDRVQRLLADRRR